MNKAKSVFECNSCSQQFLKWQGCCPGCNNWNSINEKKVTPAKVSTASTQTMQRLNSIGQDNTQKIVADFAEWNRALGGGIVPGSISILTGDPGLEPIPKFIDASKCRI